MISALHHSQISALHHVQVAELLERLSAEAARDEAAPSNEA